MRFLSSLRWFILSALFIILPTLVLAQDTGKNLGDVFNGDFLVVVGVFSAATMFAVEALKDLFNISSLSAKRFLAFISSSILVIATKYLGAAPVWAILVQLGYSGEIPNPIADAGWFYWISVNILSFLGAIGLYVFLKRFQK